MDKNKLTENVPLTPGLAHYCMTARYHSGDENGKSSAKFKALVLSDEARNAGYEDVWLVFEDYVFMKESSSSLKCRQNPAVVITGREHEGDENGMTYYQLARVMARKAVGDTEKDALRTCVADDFVEITNKKESEAKWVESGGRVMVGRTHKGDENGETVTKFARIYILDDKDGTRYPLDLADEKVLDECKESKSNFEVDSPDFDNTFTAWAAPAFSQEWINHTWVKSHSPEGKFCCAGGTSEDYFIREVGVIKNAYAIMDKCRGNVLWMKDCAEILYVYDGVCHQMSNRFLFPVSGKYMVYNDHHPKGYKTSTLVYGLTGIGYETWYMNVFLPAAKQHGVELEVQENMSTAAYDRERELEALRTATAAVFVECNITTPADTVLEAQREWLGQREDIMKKYGFMSDSGARAVPSGLTEESVRAMVGEVINAHRKLFSAVRDKVGVDNFRLLNDGEDAVKDIVDVDTALQYYLD